MKKFNRNRKATQNRQKFNGRGDDGDIDMDGPAFHRTLDRNRRFKHMESQRAPISQMRRRPLDVKCTQENFWNRIIIPNGKRIGKEFILQELTARCTVPFTAINFHIDMNNAVFYIKDRNVVDALRKLSNTIMTPLNNKMIITSRLNEAPAIQTITDVMEAAIKTAMSNRYDTANRALNLSKFDKDETLMKQGYSFSLGRLNVANCVVTVITEHIPEVVSLDLSENGMYTITSMAPLAVKCKELRTLLLHRNKIKHIRDLDSLKGLPLTEVQFSGCPFTTQYKTVDSYVSAVRDRFPRVVKLDLKELPPPIVFDLEEEKILVPRSLPSHLPDETVRPLIVGFVEQFFACFDSPDRSPLLDAYHEAAVFSLSSVTVVNSKTQKERERLDYKGQSRNFMRLHSDEEKRRLLLQGRLNILDFFKRFGSTCHDPTSFVVDLSMMLPTMMIFHVCGVFREDTAEGAPKLNLRSFQRTFVVVPQGQGLAIVNEEWFITIATERQNRAYQQTLLPSLSRPPSPAVGTSTSSLEVREGILLEFMQKTQMNRKFATDCLEQHNWVPDAAFSVYWQLKQSGKLPPEAFQI